MLNIKTHEYVVLHISTKLAMFSMLASEVFTPES